MVIFEIIGSLALVAFGISRLLPKRRVAAIWRFTPELSDQYDVEDRQIVDALIAKHGLANLDDYIDRHDYIETEVMEATRHRTYWADALPANVYRDPETLRQLDEHYQSNHAAAVTHIMALIFDRLSATT